MSRAVIASVGRGGGRLGLRRVVLLALLLWLWGGAATALASAGGVTKVVRYDGYRVVVPAGWPVYNLAAHPAVCVRFNRNAVYLGRPGPKQACPPHSVGRTEAILIEPWGGSEAGGGVAPVMPSVSGPRAQGGQPSAGQLSVPAHRLIVTATWHEHPGIVQRALGRRSLPAVPTATPGARVAPAMVLPAPGARARVASAASGGDPVYSGLGFDACSAPSASQLAAWGSSPYRAVGVYVGGTNMACSQPNLTAAWVAGQEAAGWYPIPVYVGLQAPGNSCGCAAIDPSEASAEGSAAASDAVSDARALGIGAGNPIYFDMEAYAPGGLTTSAVLAFLSAWTTQLHADGYESGVYGSAASGISDLVAQYGTGYNEPDQIWFADWNGEQTSSSPYIPSGDWGAHQRLHQYSGGVDETYGGVTLNIDGDYLGGAVAGPAPSDTGVSGPAATVNPRRCSGRAPADICWRATTTAADPARWTPPPASAWEPRHRGPASPSATTTSSSCSGSAPTATSKKSTSPITGRAAMTSPAGGRRPRRRSSRRTPAMTISACSGGDPAATCTRRGTGAAGTAARTSPAGRRRPLRRRSRLTPATTISTCSGAAPTATCVRPRTAVAGSAPQR